MCTKGPPKCTRKGNVVCWCSIVKSTLCRLTLFGALNVSALCYDPCREVANTEPLTNLQLSRNHFVISYILFRIIPCLSMVPFAMKTCFFPLKFSVRLLWAPQMIVPTEPRGPLCSYEFVKAVYTLLWPSEGSEETQTGTTSILKCEAFEGFKIIPKYKAS